MHLIQLLAIICYLTVNVEGFCLTFAQPYEDDNNLRISDNPVLEADDMVRAGWYRKINWNKDVNDNLQLNMKRETSKGEGIFSGSGDICNLRDASEWGSWALIVRDILGIPAGCPVKKGEVEVDGGYFTAIPCREVKLNNKGDTTRQKVWLDLKDADDNLILTGYIDIWL